MCFIALDAEATKCAAGAALTETGPAVALKAVWDRMLTLAPPAPGGPQGCCSGCWAGAAWLCGWMGRTASFRPAPNGRATARSPSWPEASGQASCAAALTSLTALDALAQQCMAAASWPQQAALLCWSKGRGSTPRYNLRLGDGVCDSARCPHRQGPTQTGVHTASALCR